MLLALPPSSCRSTGTTGVCHCAWLPEGPGDLSSGSQTRWQMLYWLSHLSWLAHFSPLPHLCTPCLGLCTQHHGFCSAGLPGSPLFRKALFKTFEILLVSLVSYPLSSESVHEKCLKPDSGSRIWSGFPNLSFEAHFLHHHRLPKTLTHPFLFGICSHHLATDWADVFSWFLLIPNSQIITSLSL